MNIKISLLLCMLLSQSLMAGNLTQIEAEQRKEQIENVSYELKFHFQKDSESFQGETLIKVNLKDLTRPLKIDFAFLGLKKLEINGKKVSYHFQNDQLVIPESVLSKSMMIKVIYEGRFSGLTLKKFKDGDGLNYFYSHLSGFLAHHLFPCFDQSDIKARFKLQIMGPADWTLISNESASTIEKVKSGVKTYFNETKLLPPGLFFIAGGNYVEFKDEHKGVPLRIFVRKSLSQQLDSKKIFSTVKKGLDFFTKYLNMPYPFSKYDHIFVPDFGYSGMENPGAITLNERYVLTSTAPSSIHMKFAELIYHEMAHIWFGGVVSHKWWNDLWLNESFATYFSHLALKEENNQEHALLFQSQKIWGYREDQIESTSHPVVDEIPDVLTSHLLLDGITYSKGASALQQLHYAIGDRSFQESIRTYIGRNLFGNATYNDYFSSIKTTERVDIKAWSKAWIRSRGTHRISHEVTCNKGKIKSFAITQEKNFSKILSPHKTTYGFYKFQNDDLVEMERIVFDYSGRRTEMTSPVGKECPDFVLPNVDDRDFGFFPLKKEVINKLPFILEKIANPLIRYNILISLERSLNNQLITPEAYMDVLLSWLKTEENENLLSLVNGLQDFRFGLLKNPFLANLTHDQRKKYSQTFEELILKRMQGSNLSHAKKMVLLDYLLLMGRTNKLGSLLYNVIMSKDKVLDLYPDQLARWKIIIKLSQLHDPKAQELLEEESKRDQSFTGQIRAYAAKVARPEREIKQSVWQDFFAPEKFPYLLVKTSSEFIYDDYNPELNNAFVENYFKKISSIDWERYKGYEDLYFHELYPLKLCSDEVLQQSRKYFQLSKTLTPHAKKRWLMAQDDLDRCILSRKM